MGINTSLGFSKENWQQVLDTLGFREVKNPNGVNCYDILNENGVPVWQYENAGIQEQLYYFFAGMVYQKLR